jgi:hypothetical protein
MCIYTPRSSRGGLTGRRGGPHSAWRRAAPLERIGSARQRSYRRSFAPQLAAISRKNRGRLYASDTDGSLGTLLAWNEQTYRFLITRTGACSLAPPSGGCSRTSDQRSAASSKQRRAVFVGHRCQCASDSSGKPTGKLSRERKPHWRGTMGWRAFRSTSSSVWPRLYSTRAGVVDRTPRLQPKSESSGLPELPAAPDREAGS